MFPIAGPCHRRRFPTPAAPSLTSVLSESAKREARKRSERLRQAEISFGRAGHDPRPYQRVVDGVIAAMEQDAASGRGKDADDARTPS